MLGSPSRAARRLALWALAAQISAAQTLPEKLIEAGHWKRARSIVETRFQQQPNDPLTNFLLSQIRNAFGDRESPMKFAERAVALDGGTARYHRQVAEVIGVTAQHAGLLQQVLLGRRFKKEIDTAISLDPGDTQALRDLMEFYLLAPAFAGGDRSKAAATARRIAQTDAAEGGFAQARLAAASREEGKVEGYLRGAVDAQPANYKARMALANFYKAPDRLNLEAAAQQAKEAMSIDPKRAEAYAILAELYAVRGQWAEMESTLATAAAEVPDDLLPHYRAAEAIVNSGRDLSRAEPHYHKYLAAEPEGNTPLLGEAQRKLGMLLDKLSRTSAAGVTARR